MALLELCFLRICLGFNKFGYFMSVCRHPLERGLFWVTKKQLLEPVVLNVFMPRPLVIYRKVLWTFYILKVLCSIGNEEVHSIVLAYIPSCESELTVSDFDLEYMKRAEIELKMHYMCCLLLHVGIEFVCFPPKSHIIEN